jgi:hypothetical protein
LTLWTFWHSVEARRWIAFLIKYLRQNKLNLIPISDINQTGQGILYVRQTSNNRYRDGRILAGFRAGVVAG